MSLLKGKKILITGVASKLSIATGIAASCHKQGAELAFTYQNDRLKQRVIDIAKENGSELCFPCDLSQDDQIEEAFQQLAKHWSGLDGIVHAVGFAPQDQLQGDFVDATTREGFNIAHDISSYTFVALAKAGRSLLSETASLLTLTYYGSEKTLPNYNVMGLAKASLEAAVRYMAVSMGKQGVRVNAISAGPIKTLAASGIKDFRKMLKYNEMRTPLKRNVTIDEVGDAAAFLCSDMARGISGQVVFVDAGFQITAMSDEEGGLAAD